MTDSQKLKALVEAVRGITDMLNNHYGDDGDETPLIDAVFEALENAVQE